MRTLTFDRRKIEFVAPLGTLHWRGVEVDVVQQPVEFSTSPIVNNAVDAHAD